MITWILISAVVGGLVGLLAGRSRGQPELGLLLGVILGPIGWLLVLVGQDLRRKCRECLGVVPEDARKCQHCGSDLVSAHQVQSVPAVPAVLQVAAGVWKEDVECPACGTIAQADEGERRRGLRCGQCGVGWVPGVR